MEEAALKAKLAKGTPPGDGGAQFIPCGNADGVIFRTRMGFMKMANGVAVFNEESPSMESQAVRYLRRLPEAQRRNWDGSVNALGVFRNSGDFMDTIIFHNPELKSLRQSGILFDHLMVGDEKGINCNQPQHMPYWTVHKVEDGIWALVYDK